MEPSISQSKAVKPLPPKKHTKKQGTPSGCFLPLSLVLNLSKNYDWMHFIVNRGRGHIVLWFEITLWQIWECQTPTKREPQNPHRIQDHPWFFNGPDKKWKGSLYKGPNHYRPLCRLGIHSPHNHIIQGTLLVLNGPQTRPLNGTWETNLRGENCI